MQRKLIQTSLACINPVVSKGFDSHKLEFGEKLALSATSLENATRSLWIPLCVRVLSRKCNLFFPSKIYRERRDSPTLEKAAPPGAADSSPARPEASDSEPKG